MIVAALIALVQIDAARSGRPSIFNLTVTTAFSLVQSGVAATLGGVRGAFESVANAPHLSRDNRDLKEKNGTLERENASLREAVAQAPGVRALGELSAKEPGSIEARIIAYDPEGQSRIVTIDKGANAGVRPDEGVVNEGGAVGRVVTVEPVTSKVLLLTDPASKLPAIVQRGRWWGIAAGTSTRMQLQYVSQDARLRDGDYVVTGEGRSFHTGFPIGKIVKIFHAEGALYQTAVIEPSASFGRLERVLVLPK
ncbi:MAG: rod shape-determining protein MreC [Candidatus Eremiobacteraeota bacterium]|nr:rod shape-determining protein MreC [Candidatus Eremiobacteraeota bacterium]